MQSVSGMLFSSRRSADQAFIKFDTYVGRRADLHCTSLGKVLLACSSDAVVRDFLSADSFVKYTDVTITSRAAYKEELVKVRQKGYAVDDEEEEPGVSRPQSTRRVDVGPECDRRHRPDRPRKL